MATGMYVSGGAPAAAGRLCRGGPCAPAAARPRLALRPLEAAVAEGRAVFGTSPVAALDISSAARLRKLRRRLEAVFAGLPGVEAGRRGVWHPKTGLTFGELDLGDALQLAGAGFLAGCGTAHAGPLSPRRPVEIVTGFCLGGATALTGISGARAYPLTDPQTLLQIPGRIDSLAVDERLHVYEAESVCRITAFVRALAAHLGGRLRVRAHIPAPEYVALGLHLHAHGHLTAAMLERYRAAVRRRAARLRTLLEGHLRGVCQVVASSPMAWLEDADVTGAAPSQLARMLHNSAQRQDRLWHGLLPPGSPPSLPGLAFASYLHHYLAAARDAQRQGAQLMVVESPDEERILRLAARAGSRAGVSMTGTVACYLHPQVVVTDTAFGLPGQLLYNCQDGCHPHTVQFAVGRYARTALTPLTGPPGKPQPKSVTGEIDRRELGAGLSGGGAPEPMVANSAARRPNRNRRAVQDNSHRGPAYRTAKAAIGAAAAVAVTFAAACSASPATPNGAAAPRRVAPPAPARTAPAASRPATRVVPFPLRVGRYRLVNKKDRPVPAARKDRGFPRKFPFAADAWDGFYLPGRRESQIVYLTAGQLSPGLAPATAIGDYLGEFEGQEVHLTTEPPGPLGGQVQCWESGGITFCMWADQGTYGVVLYQPPFGLDTALIHQLDSVVAAFRQAVERAAP